MWGEISRCTFEGDLETSHWGCFLPSKGLQLYVLKMNFVLRKCYWKGELFPHRTCGQERGQKGHIKALKFWVSVSRVQLPEIVGSRFVPGPSSSEKQTTL